MSSIGMSELLVIFGIALLLFGNRLPQVGKSIGEGIRDFKRGLRDNDGDKNENLTTAATTTGNAQATAINQPSQNLTNGLPTSQHTSHRNPEHIIDVQHVNK